MIDDLLASSVPLVSEHDTWISVDPIVGCPANCTYCYLGPLGWRARKPVERVKPAALVSEVKRYLAERSSGDSYMRLGSTPISFGNYTDTFMSAENIEYLREYAKLHAAEFQSHPLCVVTKARLAPRDLYFLDSIGHPIILFLSQSFLNGPGVRKAERGPTSRPEDTLRNIELISGLENIKAVHFLRPATRRSMPDLISATNVLRQVRDAGCLATVAVGLKVGPGVKMTDAELRDLLGDESRAVPGSSEVFPEDVREHLLNASKTLNYPLYFHTSCAVALATGCAEALGTWREPVRSTRCEPCQCPSPQRSRCDLARDQVGVPPAAEATRVGPWLELPEGAIHWSERESAYRLDRPIRQYKFNLLVHALPYRIVGKSVKTDEAWLGPFAEDHGLSDDCGQWDPDELLAPGPRKVGTQMFQAIQRLYGITGFVTTLHSPDDLRPLAFARYFHVRRVVWVAEWLRSNVKNIDPIVDASTVSWLSWAHDLNRWPFAHNSEKGIFDQACDIRRYVSAADIGFPQECLAVGDSRQLRHAGMLYDLEGIISKRAHGLSRAGRVVLLADIIAGLIEDPLLAITGLDLTPRLIPDKVREELAMPLDRPQFREELSVLNCVLYKERDVKKYMVGFDAIFRKCVREFARKHQLIEADPLEESWFGELRNLLKEGFLRKVLFPYNNEKVAHGSLLKTEVIAPLCAVLGERSAAVLTAIDEAEALRLAIKHNIIDDDTQARYFPDLDYIASHEPENSFRCTI